MATFWYVGLLSKSIKQGTPATPLMHLTDIASEDWSARVS